MKLKIIKIGSRAQAGRKYREKWIEYIPGQYFGGEFFPLGEGTNWLPAREARGLKRTGREVIISRPEILAGNPQEILRDIRGIIKRELA